MSALAAGRAAGEFDLLIAGAGVVGLSMACLAVARRLAPPGRIALIGEFPTPGAGAAAADWDLRVFALSRASQRVLELGGAWRAVPPDRQSPYERMCVWEAHGTAQESLTFDCAEIGEPDLGHIVEGRALQNACLQAARAVGIVCIDAAVTGLDAGPERVRVALSDGRQLQGPLLVGADGTDSTVRRLLDVGTGGHSYQQDALVVHVRTSQPHRRTAWQRFLPTGPLAFLPLPDGRSSIVWSAPRAEAARLQSLDAGAFGSALSEAVGGFLGACEPASPRATFPLKMQFALEYVRPRVALVGDAAHVVHPLAGQGLNLGLLDCAALADVLGEASGPAAFGDLKLLRRYERWRRSENLLAAAAMDGLERLFSAPGPALARLRTAGLAAVQRAPAVKRLLARQALGTGGDLPDFLR